MSDILSSVDDIYEKFGQMNDESKSQEEKENIYRQLIETIHTSGENERKLASQLICRCSNAFPDLKDSAVEAIQRLAADESPNLRKQAIHDLPLLVKQYPDCLKAVTCTITKMLSADDQSELSLVHKALLTLIDQHPLDCICSLFDEIDSSYERPLVQNGIISFVLNKHQPILHLGPEGRSKLPVQLQTDLVKRLKESLERSDAGELFIGMVQLIQKFPVCQTASARKELTDCILEKARMSQSSASLHGAGKLVIILSCIQQCLALFSRDVVSTQFACFALDTLMPQLRDEQWSSEERLQILRMLAELMSFCGPMDNEDGFIRRYDEVFKFLKSFLVAPPDDPSDSVDPNFELSAIECVLFTYHSMYKTNTEYVQSNESLLEDFKTTRIRLQYLGQAVQHYLRQLKHKRQSMGDACSSNVDEGVCQASIKVCSNIHQMIRDLFHNPPSFKSNVELSWKPSSQQSKQASCRKRVSTDVMGDEGDCAKRVSRPDRELYDSRKAHSVRRFPRPNNETLQRRRERFA